jgi:hypothetical protein
MHGLMGTVHGSSQCGCVGQKMREPSMIDILESIDLGLVYFPENFAKFFTFSVTSNL